MSCRCLSHESINTKAMPKPCCKETCLCVEDVCSNLCTHCSECECFKCELCKEECVCGPKEVCCCTVRCICCPKD
ncbi:hypothetical protein FHG87_014458 [Trinorchestia longiramus]|nr:hypothetical protein FHG87_014458 [Trinorchestia longiramus]